MKIKVGCIQLLVEGGEPERNINRAKKFIEEAALKGCKLVILPETMDFGWTHPSLRNEADLIPGYFSNFFSKIAKALKIFICVGLTEKFLIKDEIKFYNTAILIDDNGEIILKHRKINEIGEAKNFYETGYKTEVINTAIGCIGVNICSDNYPSSLEIGSCLGVMGANLLISPSSWTIENSYDHSKNPYLDKWLDPLKFLAEKYKMTIIATTSVGYIVGGPFENRKMLGCSLIVNENGLIKMGNLNEIATELIIEEIEIKKKDGIFQNIIS